MKKLGWTALLTCVGWLEFGIDEASAQDAIWEERATFDDTLELGPLWSDESYNIEFDSLRSVSQMNTNVVRCVGRTRSQQYVTVDVQSGYYYLSSERFRLMGDVLERARDVHGNLNAFRYRRWQFERLAVPRFQLFTPPGGSQPPSMFWATAQTTFSMKTTSPTPTTEPRFDPLWVQGGLVSLSVPGSGSQWIVMELRNTYATSIWCRLNVSSPTTDPDWAYNVLQLLFAGQPSIAFTGFTASETLTRGTIVLATSVDVYELTSWFEGQIP